MKLVLPCQNQWVNTKKDYLTQALMKRSCTKSKQAVSGNQKFAQNYERQ